MHVLLRRTAATISCHDNARARRYFDPFRKDVLFYKFNRVDERGSPPKEKRDELALRLGIGRPGAMTGVLALGMGHSSCVGELALRMGQHLECLRSV